MKRIENETSMDLPWYDLWHVHPNTASTGDRWPNLVAAWSRAEDSGRACGRPWQSWVVIARNDPSDDAVFLHTPNPNRDNFPYPFAGVDWDIEPPEWVTGAGLQFGRSNHEGLELLWVRREVSMLGLA